MNPTDMTQGSTVGRYLVFALGAENFAIPLLKVREVIAMPEVTPIPQTPAHFLGIMNLRGQVISIVDLRNKLKIKPKEKNSESAVIICDLGALSIGVVVDEVTSVFNIDSKDFQKRPQIESNMKTTYIEGVCQREGKLILLLNISEVLDVNDHNLINRSTKSAA